VAELGSVATGLKIAPIENPCQVEILFAFCLFAHLISCSYFDLIVNICEIDRRTDI
jgi:hypothetical protein